MELKTVLLVHILPGNRYLGYININDCFYPLAIHKMRFSLMYDYICPRVFGHVYSLDTTISDKLIPHLEHCL